MMLSHTSNRRRRFAVPLIILAAAAAFAIWGTQRESERSADIHEFVHALCQDIANQRDPAVRLGRLDPFTAKQMVDFLRLALNDLPPSLDGLVINVRSGDNPEFGNGSATHTAMIRIRDRDTLGLRIVHQDQGGDLGIVGIWFP